MPRLLLRSSRGLVNALEVLSIIKHYGGIAEISGSALQSFYAPRDAFTKRPLGFVFIEADQSSADAILAAGTQYVKAPLPSGQSRRSTASLTLHQQAARNRISLQDILNLRASPLATGLQADSADQPEEEDRILEITAEAALDKRVQRPDQQIRGHLAAKRGNAEYLADAMMMFNGFASPGKIRFGRTPAFKSTRSSLSP